MPLGVIVNTLSVVIGGIIRALIGNKLTDDFKEKVNSHKGFCLPHFGDMLNYATCHLSDKQQKEFSDTFFPLMEKSMQRLYKDVSWLIDKFDYRYKDADWGDSKEALQNCMQKLKGGYPADPVYKQQKRSTTPPSSTC